VPPYLKGTGAYWGPLSVLWGQNGGSEPKMEPGRSPACARPAETWAISLHAFPDGSKVLRLVARLKAGYKWSDSAHFQQPLGS